MARISAFRRAGVIRRGVQCRSAAQLIEVELNSILGMDPEARKRRGHGSTRRHSFVPSLKWGKPAFVHKWSSVCSFGRTPPGVNLWAPVANPYGTSHRAPTLKWFGGHLNDRND